jgi:hypothetical protein
VLEFWVPGRCYRPGLRLGLCQVAGRFLLGCGGSIGLFGKVVKRGCGEGVDAGWAFEAGQHPISSIHAMLRALVLKSVFMSNIILHGTPPRRGLQASEGRWHRVYVWLGGTTLFRG